MELLDSVKAYVNASDANLDDGELCRNTWECYALQKGTNGPLSHGDESDLV